MPNQQHLLLALRHFLGMVSASKLIRFALAGFGKHLETVQMLLPYLVVISWGILIADDHVPSPAPSQTVARAVCLQSYCSTEAKKAMIN